MLVTMGVTIVLALLLSGAVLLVLLLVRTPYYRPSRQRAIQTLQWVLMGQATANDWRIFCDFPARHDELLESVRLRCEQIEEECYTGDTHPPYLFSTDGRARLRELLDELMQAAPLR